jgi:hypothetical protein
VSQKARNKTCPENDPVLESEIIPDNILPENKQVEEKIFHCLEPKCIAQFTKLETYNITS